MAKKANPPQEAESQPSLWPVAKAAGTLAMLGAGLAAAVTSEQWIHGIQEFVQAAIQTVQQVENIVTANGPQLETLALTGLALALVVKVGSIGAPDVPD